MRVTAEEPPLPRLTYKRIPTPAASPEDRPLLTWAILSGIEGEAPRKAETRPPKVAPTAPDAGAYETPIEPAPAPEDGNEPVPPRSDFESG